MRMVQLDTSFERDMILVQNEMTVSRLVAEIGSDGTHKIWLECLKYNDGTEMFSTHQSLRRELQRRVPNLLSCTEEEYFQESLVLHSSLEMEVILAVQKKFFEYLNETAFTKFREVVFYDVPEKD